MKKCLLDSQYYWYGVCPYCGAEKTAQEDELKKEYFYDDIHTHIKREFATNICCECGKDMIYYNTKEEHF